MLLRKQAVKWYFFPPHPTSAAALPGETESRKLRLLPADTENTFILSLGHNWTVLHSHRNLPQAPNKTDEASIARYHLLPYTRRLPSLSWCRSLCPKWECAISGPASIGISQLTSPASDLVVLRNVPEHFCSSDVVSCRLLCGFVEWNLHSDGTGVIHFIWCTVRGPYILFIYFHFYVCSFGHHNSYIFLSIVLLMTLASTHRICFWQFLLYFLAWRCPCWLDL